MTSGLKTEVSISDFEVESQDLHQQSKARLCRMVDSLRVGMTVLALVAGIVILGLSADSLAVYQRTNLPSDFLLHLWPEKFDLRPTTALVAGSAIVTVANAVSLLTSKTQSLRRRTGAHTSVSLAAPVIGMIASIVAIGLFYSINASTTVDTFQSWTCRWEDVGMLTQPHFGTLCKESQAGLALAVLLVPLEVIVVAVAGYQVMLERKFQSAPHRRGDKARSPSMS